jgi:hypothetical protein
MSSSKLVTEHQMPEVAAIELTDRQQEILYQREVEEKSRADIATDFDKSNGDGTLSDRGVESHLRVARKKRQLAVNTLCFVAQIGAYDVLNLDVPHPDEIDFPAYVTVPDSVSHNETCLFERQKNILFTVCEHNDNNKQAVRTLISRSELEETHTEFTQQWKSGSGSELQTQLATLVDSEPESFSDLRESLEQKVIDDAGFRNKLIEDITDYTSVWDEKELSTQSAIELFIKFAASKRTFDKKYTTLRQYKYYRLPEKLSDCYESALQPKR